MGLLHYTFGNLTKEMGFCTRYSFGNLTKGMGAEQVKGVPSVIGFPHCTGFRKGLCRGWARTWEAGTFRLQTVGSTAAPGLPFVYNDLLALGRCLFVG